MNDYEVEAKKIVFSNSFYAGESLLVRITPLRAVAEEVRRVRRPRAQLTQGLIPGMCILYNVHCPIQ
jgi:hypothetical protein